MRLAPHEEQKFDREFVVGPVDFATAAVSRSGRGDAPVVPFCVQLLLKRAIIDNPSVNKKQHEAWRVRVNGDTQGGYMMGLVERQIFRGVHEVVLRSGILVERFLEDEEFSRTAPSCHLSMDLLCQEM